MPAIPIITGVVGAASAVKGLVDSSRAGKTASSAGQNAQVNIPQVSQMATDQALKNIALSRQVENQYNPENQLLRQGSILGLMAQLGQNPNQDIYTHLQEQLNGGPLPAQTADSALLRQAVAQASTDLAQGGNLPLDVRNLVARNAAGKSAGLTGHLGLGQDISARDLGLTSLDLMQRRLTNAQALGQADLGSSQFNAQMRQRANEFGATNNLNLAGLMAQLNGQDFSKWLSAAQLGQGIQAPQVGLDPSAIANLAVGNTNAATQAGMNAAGIQAQSGNNLANFGGQLFGYGIGNMTNPGGISAPKAAAPTSNDWNPYGASTTTSWFQPKF